jgi:hypothetical protein
MKLLAVLVSLATVAAPASLVAQERDLFNDFSTQLPTDHTPSMLGADLFGEQYDSNSGAASFLVTDISIPGNSELPVVLQRSLKAWDDGVRQNFVWSTPDVPYISGLYKRLGGWVVDAPDPQKRCSAQGGTAEPPEVSNSSGQPDTFFPNEYWHGLSLHMPGQGATELLRGPVAGAPVAPTSDGPYYWVTNDLWYFACLSSTRNNVAGEGFLAVAPNGFRYFFDWIVRRDTTAAIRKAAPLGGTTVLSRDEYRALVTRIEDQFGNYVDYSYSGERLVSIEASDGRKLTIVPDGSGAVGSVVAQNNDSDVNNGDDWVWQYGYSGSTSTVTHPDGTQWSSTVTHSIARNNNNCENAEPGIQFTGQATVSITHNTGATGVFLFEPLRRGM